MNVVTGNLAATEAKRQKGTCVGGATLENKLVMGRGFVASRVVWGPLLQTTDEVDEMTV